MDKPIYPGGFYDLVRAFETRRTPFANWHAALPAADADLAPFFTRTVSGSTPPPPRAKASDILTKRDEFRTLLDGQPEAQLLHALLIAILRRRDPPDQARRLFFRLWADHSEELLHAMPVRWMVSAATTFADIGETGDQRSCGMGLSILFDTIKLYESERSYYGISGRKLFKRDAGRKLHSMPFGVTRYSYKGGDLDRNMLARLWLLSEQDDTIRPLAQTMLMLVMTDTRTVFSRVERMKADRATRRGNDAP